MITKITVCTFLLTFLVVSHIGAFYKGNQKAMMRCEKEKLESLEEFIKKFKEDQILINKSKNAIQKKVYTNITNDSDDANFVCENAICFTEKQ